MRSKWTSARTASGRLMLGILTTRAEHERVLRYERAAAAREAAIVCGKAPGRPKAHPAAKPRSPCGRAPLESRSPRFARYSAGSARSTPYRALADAEGAS